MTLLQKTTRLYVAATALILLLAGFALFLILQASVRDEMEEELALQAELIAEDLAAGEHSHIPLTTIVEVPPEAATRKRVFGDTLVYDQVQRSAEDYYYYTDVHPVNGRFFKITVMDAYMGWSQYYTTILVVFLLMGLLLGIAGAAINYFLTRTIWHPFFENLRRLQGFSVSAAAPLQLHDTGIREFSELKEVLEEMATRSRQEYRALREFTENASHEIQTPLAIIRSKLDRLAQYPMSEEMSEHIVHAKVGVDRLTRMNKNLLLLAKLDNRAFQDIQPVDFSAVVQEHVDLMGELFAMRGILLEVDLMPVELAAQQYLSGVLVSNLLSNALRYTPQDGMATATLSAGGFTVTNSGEPLDFPPGQLFDRFKRSHARPETTGLGLAIVFEICRMHAWVPDYGYEEGQHRFTIRFR
ncbi:HAMP domain-containing histidine kinase [Pontibacter sp. E15-1]|uniref:sensor histidine kinase n=1 Tax=Pontibacter sp. E15-1 TaxID=2919918 RepID=UPI001F5002B5|nr:HAMP domain-containing sensor histidine kinase [Pontibacter sp. E15-1]MCJ8165364.1 HAMP domain-containing histidine kinase [Pontibacter sp. E15-1]